MLCQHYVCICENDGFFFPIVVDNSKNVLCHMWTALRKIRTALNTPGRMAIENVNTIDERRPKIVRNRVFDCQMAIENTVSIEFWSEFVDC